MNEVEIKMLACLTFRDEMKREDVLTEEDIRKAVEEIKEDIDNFIGTNAVSVLETQVFEKNENGKTEIITISDTEAMKELENSSIQLCVDKFKPKWHKGSEKPKRLGECYLVLDFGNQYDIARYGEFEDQNFNKKIGFYKSFPERGWFDIGRMVKYWTELPEMPKE